MPSFDDNSGYANRGNYPLHLHIFTELLFISFYKIF